MKALQQITALPRLPARPDQGHKGTFGKVLVIGGSEGMIGAPGFAGLAALRMGCGLAYVASPGEVLGFILAAAPELVGIAVGSKPGPRLAAAVASCDATIVGPGMGQSSTAADLLKLAIKTAAPVLLDADALNLIASGKAMLRRKPNTMVLTPHPGEMVRLARQFDVFDVPHDQPGRIKVAVAAARHFQQIVVLKGHRTIISDGQRYAVNMTGDSTLAKGGSGDILCGMIGTLLAQGMPPFEAAMLGVHLHGKAGEYAGRQVGKRSALAREVIDAIPTVLEVADRPGRST